jgi:hypothetical protein
MSGRVNGAAERNRTLVISLKGCRKILSDQSRPARSRHLREERNKARALSPRTSDRLLSSAAFRPGSRGGCRAFTISLRVGLQMVGYPALLGPVLISGAFCLPGCIVAPLAPELEVDIMKATPRNLGGCNALIAVWLDCPNAGRLTPAAARKTRHHNRTQPTYSACVCHWGYATDNSGDACTVAVSCDSEGGQCARPCPPMKGGE